MNYLTDLNGKILFESEDENELIEKMDELGLDVEDVCLGNFPLSSHPGYCDINQQ